MVPKPKIQYVGQFYVYGSEARQLEEKKQKAKASLPKPKTYARQKVYVDFVAIVGITVAVVMLVVMLAGALQLHADWQEYQQMSSYVSQLRRENAALRLDYRFSYDIQDIQAKADGLGLVPVSEVTQITVKVRPPQPEPELTRWEEFLLFFQGLFA